MTYQTVPTIWQLATVISASKPGKVADDCERLLQAFRAIILKPVLDPQLPDKQAGIMHSPCITDQVFKLTYNAEHRFEENNKPGIVLIDLTVAHDSLLCGRGDVGPMNHPHVSAPLQKLKK